MRELTTRDLSDAARGAAVLGAGGGGRSPHRQAPRPGSTRGARSGPTGGTGIRTFVTPGPGDRCKRLLLGAVHCASPDPKRWSICIVTGALLQLSVGNEDESGRGPAMVDVLAGHRWGQDLLADGKIIWFEIGRLCHSA